MTRWGLEERLVVGKMELYMFAEERRVAIVGDGGSSDGGVGSSGWCLSVGV